MLSVDYCAIVVIARGRARQGALWLRFSAHHAVFRFCLENLLIRKRASARLPGGIANVHRVFNLTA